MPLSSEFSKSLNGYDVEYALLHIRKANIGTAHSADESEITNGLAEVAQIIFDTNGKVTHELEIIERELGGLGTMQELIEERSRISPLYYRNVDQGPDANLERDYQEACEKVSYRWILETKQRRIRDILENQDKYERKLWETIDELPENATNRDTQQRIQIVKGRVRDAILQFKPDTLQAKAA